MCFVCACVRVRVRVSVCVCMHVFVCLLPCVPVYVLVCAPHTALSCTSACAEQTPMSPLWNATLILYKWVDARGDSVLKNAEVPCNVCWLAGPVQCIKTPFLIFFFFLICCSLYIKVWEEERTNLGVRRCSTRISIYIFLICILNIQGDPSRCEKKNI